MNFIDQWKITQISFSSSTRWDKYLKKRSSLQLYVRISCKYAIYFFGLRFDKICVLIITDDNINSDVFEKFINFFSGPCRTYNIGTITLWRTCASRVRVGFEKLRTLNNASGNVAKNNPAWQIPFMWVIRIFRILRRPRLMTEGCAKNFYDSKFIWQGFPSSVFVFAE